MGWTWSLLLTQRKVSLSLSYCFTVRWALTLTTMSTTPGCFVCLVVLIVCICFCLTTNNSLRFTPFTPRTLIISFVLKEAMFFRGRSWMTFPMVVIWSSALTLTWRFRFISLPYTSVFLQFNRKAYYWFANSVKWWMSSLSNVTNIIDGTYSPDNVSSILIN